MAMQYNSERNSLFNKNFALSCIFIGVFFNGSASASERLERVIISDYGAYIEKYNNESIEFDPKGIYLNTTWEFWTLLGDPVRICTATWEVKEKTSRYRIKSVHKPFQSQGYSSIEEISQEVRPYDASYLVEIVPGIYANCDPGTLSPTPGKTSYDTPGSPKWNRLFFSLHNGGSLPRNYEYEKNHDEINGHAISWLTHESAKNLARRILSRDYKMGIYGRSIDENNKAIIVERQAIMVAKAQFDLSKTASKIAKNLDDDEASPNSYSKDFNIDDLARQLTSDFKSVGVDANISTVKNEPNGREPNEHGMKTGGEGNAETRSVKKPLDSGSERSESQDGSRVIYYCTTQCFHKPGFDPARYYNKHVTPFFVFNGNRSMCFLFKNAVNITCPQGGKVKTDERSIFQREAREKREKLLHVFGYQLSDWIPEGAERVF